VTIRDLVKSSLRLRPDRVIVGEVRSSEALDLINSMNTGHSGSMGTVHANNPKECLTRLETLALMSQSDVPVQAIRAQVASAINIVCQLSRLQDGSRKITHISEGLGMDLQGNYRTQDIFLFEQTGRDATGKILGEIKPTGNIPTFMKEIEVNHLPFSREILTRKGAQPAASPASNPGGKPENQVA
jgi:pilus assembly protein CpaF